MPPDDRVEVQEVAPVRVTRRQAVRIFVGRFIVDYVETFLGLLPVQVFAAFVTPQLRFSTVEEAKVAAMQWILQLAGPAFAALVSAGRRAAQSIPWAEIKAWAQRGFE
jgi:hypothetical protein